MEKINLSVEPIHHILAQLGKAITAQLEVANDRAASAETEYARLRDGIRALVGTASANPPIAANDVASPTEESVAKPKVAPAEKNIRGRTTIPDQPFLDALTVDWQSADALRKVMMASGVKVAFGTVYNRMEALTAAFPDMIEAKTSPACWRLRAPSYPKKADVVEAVKAKRVKARSKKAPPTNDMPRNAITNVPARVAAQPAPQQVFLPDLRHGNCFEVMKTLPDNSIDLILVDPPFAMTGLKIDPVIDLEAMWAEYRRILTPTGTIVAFGSQPFSSKLVCGAPDLFKHDLIWIKNRATCSLNARNKPLKQHEDILVFSAGAMVQADRTTRRYAYHPLGQMSAGLKKISTGKRSTYLRGVKHHPGRVYEGTTNNPRTTLFCPKDEDHFHPFQKPLNLLEYLIRTYSNEGGVVLDTFMGSGSTCVAAMRAGRRSVGVEMDAEHFATAEKRVALFAELGPKKAAA